MSSRELMWTLQTAVDWCFPPRTEETRVRTLTPEQLKLTPSYPAPNTHCLLPYHHPDVQALVCEAKFHFNRRAHWIIGQTLVTYSPYTPSVRESAGLTKCGQPLRPVYRQSSTSRPGFLRASAIPNRKPRYCRVSDTRTWRGRLWRVRATNAPALKPPWS